MTRTCLAPECFCQGPEHDEQQPCRKNPQASRPVMRVIANGHRKRNQRQKAAADACEQQIPDGEHFDGLPPIAAAKCSEKTCKAGNRNSYCSYGRKGSSGVHGRETLYAAATAVRISASSQKPTFR